MFDNLKMLIIGNSSNIPVDFEQKEYKTEVTPKRWLRWGKCRIGEMMHKKAKTLNISKLLDVLYDSSSFFWL